jgi:hypothetical protein
MIVGKAVINIIMKMNRRFSIQLSYSFRVSCSAG